MNILTLQYLLGVIFLTVVFSNIAKKKSASIIGYGVQSMVVTILIFDSYLKTGNLSLLFIVLLTFVVKVILAPLFSLRLMKQHQVVFSAPTYLNTPLTFIIIATLTAVAHSQKFYPLTTIIPAHQSLLALALSLILISFFLIVNRKGALSQIIGVLTFENSIGIFGIFSGLEQSVALQIGIIFDIFVWIIISTVFISMIYKHFGSLDVTSMIDLRD